MKLFSVCLIAGFPFTTKFKESDKTLPLILYWVIILAFREILCSFIALIIDLFLIRLLVILLTLSSQTNRWNISFWSGDKYGRTDFRVFDFCLLFCFHSLLFLFSILERFNVFSWIAFSILFCFCAETSDTLEDFRLYFLLILKFFFPQEFFFWDWAASNCSTKLEFLRCNKILLFS